MKFIETKREELRRERIDIASEKDWNEVRDLLGGVGEMFFCQEGWIGERWQKYLYYAKPENYWILQRTYTPTITLSELKAKYFEREPKVGDWGYFWQDHNTCTALFGRLEQIENSTFKAKGIPITYWQHFSPTIPPHIQEAMKEPQYEVVHSFGESSGEIKEIAPGLYAGTRGGVNVILKRVER